MTEGSYRGRVIHFPSMKVYVYAIEELYRSCKTDTLIKWKLITHTFRPEMYGCLTLTLIQCLYSTGRAVIDSR